MPILLSFPINLNHHHFYRLLLASLLLLILMMRASYSNEIIQESPFSTFPECSQTLNTHDQHTCESERLNMITEMLDSSYQSMILLLDQSHQHYNAKYQNAYYDNFEMPYLNVKDELIKAQVLWQQYIKSDCSMVFEMSLRGDAKEVLRLECLQDHTQSRLKALLEYRQEIELDIRAFLNSAPSENSAS